MDNLRSRHYRIRLKPGIEADQDLAFADLVVLVIGSEVAEVSFAFDRYWNNELAYPALVLRVQPPTDEEIEQKRRKLSEFIARQADTDYLRYPSDFEPCQQDEKQHGPLHRFLATFRYRIYGDAAD